MTRSITNPSALTRARRLLGLSAPRVVEAAEAVVKPNVSLIGNQPCREHGCSELNAVQCSYIDRRSRKCADARCGAHLRIVDDRPYCRRHAGTVVALASLDTDAMSWPDCDNRAPSLTNWVFAIVDPGVRTALSSQCRPGESVFSDPSVSALYGSKRRLTFRRTWTVADHTGVRLRVSVQVEDTDDSHVLVRVNGAPVASGVPPWISDRVAGDADTTAREEADRAAYIGEIVGKVEGRLTASGSPGVPAA